MTITDIALMVRFDVTADGNVGGNSDPSRHIKSHK